MIYDKEKIAEILKGKIQLETLKGEAEAFAPTQDAIAIAKKIGFIFGMVHREPSIILQDLDWFYTVGNEDQLKSLKNLDTVTVIQGR
jgi:hypothetical protein